MESRCLEEVEVATVKDGGGFIWVIGRGTKLKLEEGSNTVNVEHVLDQARSFFCWARSSTTTELH